MWWEPVTLAAVLAAFGWVLRRHFADDRATALKVDGLAEDVSFVRGVLSVAFPRASQQVTDSPPSRE